MSIEFIEQWWDSNASKRTVLYYSCKLTARYGRNFPEKNNEAILKKLVSLEEGEFKDLLRDLVSEKLFIIKNEFGLSDEAVSSVQSLIRRDIGYRNDSSLDGLTICEEAEIGRYTKWVEWGADYLISLFNQHNVPGLISTKEAVDNGNLVVLQMPHHSALLFYFVRTERMISLNSREAHHLVEHQLEYKNSGYDKVIGIIAAPTYGPRSAQDALKGRYPKWLIGPINLGAIGYYLEKWPIERKKHYYGTVEYLSKTRSGLMRQHKRGIIFSKDLIEYLQTY